MQKQASEFAAFIGIDWADRKHDVCLQIAGAPDSEASVPGRRTPYNESRYLTALQKRQSPLLKFAAAQPS